MSTPTALAHLARPTGTPPAAGLPYKPGGAGGSPTHLSLDGSRSFSATHTEKLFLMPLDAGVISYLFKQSAFVPDTYGSPGTFAMIPAPSRKEGEYNFVVVNGRGQVDVRAVSQTFRGWTNGTRTEYPTLEGLIAHLLEGYEDVLGGIVGIPFYPQGAAEEICKLLTTQPPFTYACFMTQCEATAAPETKRITLLWVNERGDVESAYLHFDFPANVWNNGGPSPSLTVAHTATDGSTSHGMTHASSDGSLPDSSGGTSTVAAAVSSAAHLVGRPATSSPSAMRLDELIRVKVGCHDPRQMTRLLYAPPA